MVECKNAADCCSWIFSGIFIQLTKYFLQISSSQAKPKRCLFVFSAIEVYPKARRISGNSLSQISSSSDFTRNRQHCSINRVEVENNARQRTQSANGKILRIYQTKRILNVEDFSNSLCSSTHARHIE